MWKHQEATKLLTPIFLVFALAAFILETSGALSNKRLCADENCKEIISLGIGKINYPAGEKGMVSFRANSKIRIISKSAGDNPSLWGIEVGGREGYAPKQYIKEEKVLISEKKLFEVDVVQKPKMPVLSTSENPVEHGNTVDPTTTKPLNLTPIESPEGVLINSSNEKLTAETSPVATPVTARIVEGTSTTALDDVISGETFTAENVKEESSIEQENSIKNHFSEISKEQEKATEFSNDNSIKETERDEVQEVNEARFSQNNNGNAFTDNNNISNLNGTEAEVQQQTEMKTGNTEENNKYEEPNVINESTADYVFNTNITNVDVPVVREEIPNVLEVKTESIAKNFAHHLDQEKSRTINNQQTNEVMNDIEANNVYQTQTSSNYNNTEKSEIDADQQQPTKKDNLNNDYSGVETNLTSEITKPDYKKETQANETKNETPLPQSETTVNGKNDLTMEISDNTTNNENSFKNPAVIEPTTEENVKISTNNISNEDTIMYTFEHQDEIVKEEQIIKENYYTTETEFNKESHVLSPNAADKENNNPNVNITKDIDELNPSSIDKSSSFSTESPPFFQETLKIEDATETNFEEAKKVLSSSVPNTIYQTPEKEVSSQAVVATEIIKQTTHNPVDDKYFNTPPPSQHDVNYQENTESSVPEYINPTTHNPVDDSFSNTLLSSQHVTYQANTENNVPESVNPTTQNPMDDVYSKSPLQFQHDVTNQENFEASALLNGNHNQHFEYEIHSVPSNENRENLPATDGNNNIPATTKATDVPPAGDNKKNEETKIVTLLPNYESKENKGLFATIMGTVNNIWNNNKKRQNELEGDIELERILFSQENVKQNNIGNLEKGTSYPYCKSIGPNGECPETSENHDHSASSHVHHAFSPLGSDFTLDAFLQSLASKILEISELLAFLTIAAAASLFFVFGYYCFCNSSREGALLRKLNQLESSLLATHKENAILKYNLMSTRQKLASIEDNSFGSNDMVVSLKKELEEELLEKVRLQEQITVLQKELENAADAGMELNKIVSELLSNQTGDESIISSVEELQKQLNEQQNTIFEINASLAEKSRENSELQLLIAEQHARYEAELANVQRDNDELDHEKGNLLTRLEEMKIDFDKDITAALEGKNLEIKRLQNEILDLNTKLENEHTKWQTSVAKIEALEECLKNVRRDPKVNINEVINVANVKAQLIETQKIYNSLKERFETELDSRKLAENQLGAVSGEVEKLKQDFNKSEKDKLEAQTRLEVLSNYFKDKENQLQKELSLKEAMWLKQQGETTTTVDRVTAMQEEIQSLKSQNDSLRAEIEAQVAAHKAQTGTLENRAHETWLAARQSDRRYEEARAEATALRRKLTALAGGNVNESIKPSTGPASIGDELTQAPSPIHMESPGSPLLGRMPPPPFLPPPFMGPPPPFMGMPPPPPFVPSGEMRPAPLGRIMSPPPQRSGRFSPQHLDYEDYIGYDSNSSWHRHTYSPPPRTYRSLSPTDSRYNYGTERDIMSTYDTENDFSPPPSPREPRRRLGSSSERIVDSATKISYGNRKQFNSSNKGPFSSGSEKSSNTHLHNDSKTNKKGNGGKSLV